MNEHAFPCRDCKSRQEGCHGTCEAYKAHSEERKAQRYASAKENSGYIQCRQLYFDALERQRRRKRR